MANSEILHDLATKLRELAAARGTYDEVKARAEIRKVLDQLADNYELLQTMRNKFGMDTKNNTADWFLNELALYRNKPGETQSVLYENGLVTYSVDPQNQNLYALHNYFPSIAGQIETWAKKSSSGASVEQESRVGAKVMQETRKRKIYTVWPSKTYLLFNLKNKRISIVYNGSKPNDLWLNNGKYLHEVLSWLCATNVEELDSETLDEERMKEFCYKKHTVTQTIYKFNDQINFKIHKILGINRDVRHELIYLDSESCEFKLRLNVHTEN